MLGLNTMVDFYILIIYPEAAAYLLRMLRNTSASYTVARVNRIVSSAKLKLEMTVALAATLMPCKLPRPTADSTI